MSTNITVQRTCLKCGRGFIAKTTVTRYCSHKCNSAFYKAKIKSEKIEKSNLETNEIKLKSKLSILDREVLTVKDVADFLGSSVDAIYDMINSGRLKAIKISARKTRVLNSELQAFVYHFPSIH